MKRLIFSLLVPILFLPQPGAAAGPPKLNRGAGLARFERQAMGEWREEKGRILQLDEKGTALLLWDEPEQGRYTASVRVRLSQKKEGGEAGLLLNLTDADHYLVYSVKNKKSGRYVQLRIVRKKPQVSFVADQAPLPSEPQDWLELRAAVEGADVYGFVNGKPALAYSFQGAAPPYNSHGKTWEPDPERGRVGLIAVDTAAGYSGFQVGPLVKFSGWATPLKGRYDARGKLLPRQSYAESMKIFTDWFLRSADLVDASKAPAPLRQLPPYLLTNFVSTDDRLWNVGGEFAFNHALVITGAVQYYLYTGDRKYLEIATKTADWEIEHSTPADWALPYLAASFVSFQPDGSWEGMDWGYEPDKSAYMGFSLLKLHAVTGEARYLEAALRIAATLRKFQGPEGNWPFRVNARTGEVKHGYSCSQLWYVWFFEKLAEVTGDKSYLENRDRAFQWLMKNPVETNQWLGLYGDIASGARSFDQWVALEAAIYLLDRRQEDPSYVEKAKGIVDWVNRMLVVDYGFFPNVPGVVEQSQYRVVLTHHELRLAEVYAKFYEVTGDPKFKDLAIEIANSVTWNYLSDGKIRQGFWHHAQACPLILSFNEQFARIMGAIPETAPDGENHLLQSSSFVQQIQYQGKKIRYKTVGWSHDLLKVSSAPKEVSFGGQTVAKWGDSRVQADEWKYNRGTGLLKVSHRSPEVMILLE